MSFLKGLSRNVVILGIVSLLTDLSSQMLFPLIPLFLTSVLGAGAVAVGVVEGAGEATASLLKVFSGYLSDKIKRRKPFVLFGYSLSTITKPLFALAYIWPFVLFVRVVERIGKGLRTAPRDALVAESTEKEFMGKSFGFERGMDGIGSMLGAILAFLLLPLFGFRNLFLIAFVPGIIAVIAILFVREKRKKQELRVNKLSVSLRSLSPQLRFVIIVSAIFAFGHFGWAFLLLKAINIGLLNTSAILLYILFYFVFSISTMPVGIISDRVGRKPVLLVGYGLFGIICLGLFFTQTVYPLIIYFMLYGIFYAIIDALQRAFVVDLSPANLKGTALGTFHTAIGLVALPGGFIAGSLWDKISPEATFVFGAVLSLLTVILFSFVKVKR